MKTLPSRRGALAAGITLAGIVCAPCVAGALQILYSENFDALQLRPPVDEQYQGQAAFTHQPPAGWDLVSRLPGVGNPQVGIFEWEGWSLANKDFWRTVAGPGRGQFLLGQGTIAVADPDRWNDRGDPANELGFYNTALTTPPIALSAAQGDRLKLVFDSSWRGGCCDDGRAFDPGGNNQTAIVSAVLPSGQKIELLHWESAPFLDAQGRPSATPTSMPNPFYKPNAPNERVAIDLTPLLGPPSRALAAITAADAGTGSGSFSIEFAMKNAGDDGWWAFDSVKIASFTTLLGDMNLSGALDPGDIDAFALGMLDENSYQFAYAGELPVSHGSLDGVFDFDDIPWFTNLMETSGVVPSASLALARALASVPEPAAAALCAGLLIPGSLRRRRTL